MGAATIARPPRYEDLAVPLQAGIVGLPNVGKSTLFNALTAAGADAANYPFATIEPNLGVLPVPDVRLEQIHSVIDTEQVVPATVEIVDIAGLVRGASQGEGLGNQFLGHIRSVDAVLHVVRCFDDDNITHIEGGVDPIRDIETVETELVLADLAMAERRLERLERAAKTGDKSAAAARSTTADLVAVLAEGQPARARDWSPAELMSLREAQLLTLKPELYVCNVPETQVLGNDYVEIVRDRAKRDGAGLVVISAQIEADIAAMEDEVERAEFLAELGLAEPGLALLARAAYDLLGLQTFFTAGPKQIRAWTLRQGATAPEAAGEIHTDFQKGFIKAEVYRVDDLLEHGSEAALRAAGKIRLEGKDYRVRDGDVIFFKFNV